MILITEFIDDAAVERLRLHHSVGYEPGLADRPEELVCRAGGARALIVRNRTQVTSKLLQNCGQLECVGRLGVGLDNIDLAACRDRGIAVYPATGANDRSVAEYVVAAGLMLLRRAFQENPAVLAGEWPRQNCVGREIEAKTLGLVGFGSIGQLVARLAGNLGMAVVACDPFLPKDNPAWKLAECRGLEDVLAGADVVSLHVPLTDDTRNLIDAGRIALIKRDAVLINTSRGGILDEDAVADALRAGRLGGAALDVFESEPVDRAYARRYSGVPNLILTPHIAGITRESNRRVSMLVAEKVMAHLGQSD